MDPDNINSCYSVHIPSKKPETTMVNMAHTIRLAEDSVIHLSILLILKRFFKKDNGTI